MHRYAMVITKEEESLLQDEASGSTWEESERGKEGAAKERMFISVKKGGTRLNVL